jgi:hypothetical protein
MTETAPAPEREPDASQGREEAGEDERPGPDADERSGQDERPERDDRDAGSSPAW